MSSNNQQPNFKRYHGCVFTDADLKKDISYYNHNYYQGYDGDLIYAESDDENLTDYYINGVFFAESFVSEGDKLIVLDKYMLEEST